MAHLEVKRKSRSKWWLWLILGIIVLVVAAFCYQRYYRTTAMVTTIGVAHIAMQIPAAAHRANQSLI